MNLKVFIEVGRCGAPVVTAGNPTLVWLLIGVGSHVKHQILPVIAPLLTSGPIAQVVVARLRTGALRRLFICLIRPVYDLGVSDLETSVMEDVIEECPATLLKAGLPLF